MIGHFPLQHHSRIRLSITLYERHRFTGQKIDLDLALGHAKDAAQACATKKVTCPTVSIFYAEMLNCETDITRNVVCHLTADQLCREALSLPNKYPLRATAMRYLGWVLCRRFESHGQDHVDEAVALQREALTETPNSTSDHHRHLRYLGSHFWRRFNILGDIRDLEEAIPLLRDAVDLCPPLHIYYENTASSLNLALSNRLEISGMTQDLEDALEVEKRFLNDGRPSGTFRFYTLNTTAIILLRLFEIHMPPDSSQLDEIVALYEEAAQSSPPGHWERLSTLNSLAGGMCLRFLWDGQLGDLEEAMRLTRLVLDRATNAPEQWLYSYNLANQLCLRYAEVGNIQDLVEAIDLFRMALRLKADNYPTTCIIIQGLASSLRLHFEFSKEEESLEEAVSLLDHVITSSPFNHNLSPIIVQELSHALLMRARQNENVEDVDRALRLLESLEQKFVDSMFGSTYLHTLGSSYLTRHRLRADGQMADAIRARNTLMDLLERTVTGRRDRFQCLLDLSELHLEHGTPFHNVSAALQYLAQGIEDNHGDVSSRITGAMHLLELIESHHSDAISIERAVSEQLLGIYSQTVNLLPRVAYFGLDLTSKLESLAASQNIALAAASHAISLHKPEQSIEILELGRGVFWSHNLRLRSHFDDVPETFRQRLVNLARQLERSADISHDDSEGRSHLAEKALAQRRRQGDEFEMLIRQVRLLPGLERFLLQDHYSALAKVADQGPVAVVVSSTIATNAIILQPKGGIIEISLPGVTETWLLETGSRWGSMVADANTEARLELSRSKNTADLEKRATFSQSKLRELQDVLAELWTRVVWPIINALNVQVRRRRVVLIFFQY
jgi:tetratricopeptide (TPR) repeat protein